MQLQQQKYTGCRGRSEDGVMNLAWLYRAKEMTLELGLKGEKFHSKGGKRQAHAKKQRGMKLHE